MASAIHPPNTPDDRRLVAESALEFLIAEMVSNMHAPSSHTHPTSTTTSTIPNTPSTPAAEPDKEAAYFKLENLGYRVGTALSERITKDRPRFADNLDVVKFICKDFWIAVFKKQIDNLKTNHRGVYVLTDSNFRWMTRMSSDASPAELTRLAFAYLAFPCGLIRGALANLGVSSVVIAEVGTMPQCTFQIKLAKT
ncbi:NO signaling/Golgi transport ligand-binding domain-containing protein [Phlyctochytrium arcticum]|nr:NO signaling/Golgi transport ligand-binding domain-containing protein [Phlyctochytrium arcticum]